jgi:hypothetical protein
MKPGDRSYGWFSRRTSSAGSCDSRRARACAKRSWICCPHAGSFPLAVMAGCWGMDGGGGRRVGPCSAHPGGAGRPAGRAFWVDLVPEQGPLRLWALYRAPATPDPMHEQNGQLPFPQRKLAERVRDAGFPLLTPQSRALQQLVNLQSATPFDIKILALVWRRGDSALALA